MKKWFKRITPAIASMLLVVICGCYVDSDKQSEDFSSITDVNTFLENYNYPSQYQTSITLFDQFPVLGQLLGNPTGNDLLKLSAELVIRLNYMKKTGMITTKDFTNMVGMLQRLTKYLNDWAKEGLPWIPEGQVNDGEEISLAAYMGYGTDEDAALKEVLHSVGADLQKMMGLVNDTKLYNMLEYAITGKQDSAGKADAAYTKLLYNVLATTQVRGYDGETLSEQEKYMRISKFLHSMLNVTYKQLLPFLDGSSSSAWLTMLGNKVTYNDIEHILTVVIKKFAGVQLKSYEKTLFNPSAVIINKIIAEAVNSALKEAAISIDFTTIQALLKYLLTPTDTTSQVYDANGKPVYIYCAKGLLVNYYGETVDGITDRNTGEKIPLIAKPFLWSPFKPLKGYTAMKGKDNPFVKNLVGLIYEIADIKDAIYNPDGKLLRNRGLADLANGLLTDKKGNNGSFNLYPLVALLYDATDERSSLETWNMIDWIMDKDCDIWAILGVDTSKTWPVAISNIIGLNNDTSLISISFLQAWFRNMDYNSDGKMDDSMLGWLLSKLDFTALGQVEMGDLLVDIYDLVDLIMTNGINPASDTFQLILNDLTMIANTLK